MEDLDRLLRLSEELKKKTLELKRKDIIGATKLYDNLFNWDTKILFTGYGSCPLTNLLGEACQDVESSIFSALHVRRKVAMMSLRSSLEQAALGLYYGKDNRSYRTNSKHRIVSFYQALDEIFSRERFREFNQEFYLKAEMEGIHRDLSAYIHSRGYEKQDWSSSKIMELEIIYEEKGALEHIETFFQDWLVFLKKVYDVISTCLFIKYMDFLALEEDTVFHLPISQTEIQSMLSKTRLSQLRSVFEY